MSCFNCFGGDDKPGCPKEKGSGTGVSEPDACPAIASEPSLPSMADLPALWGKLEAAKDSKSLLKKHLDKATYDALKDKKTKFGGTLAECIRSGCENPESGVGIYACDPEGYTTFAPVLDKVIMDYHKVDSCNHPKPDFQKDKVEGDPSYNLENAAGDDMIVSTRVRVGRSHDSFGFPPVLNKEDRIAMEKATVEALNTLEGPLKGTYYPLLGMDKATEKQLVEDHFLFKDDDRFLKAASGYDDWPVGRGIYHTPDKKFLVWVNEEDHLRLISMQKGGNLGEVYLRLVNAIQTMEKKLTFAQRDGLGWLTFCPSNLGTALRASVHIKIPLLSKQPDFNEFCAKLNVQPRGIHGEHTESVGGVYDISNKRRLGLTEFEAIQEMKKGVEAIIAKEKELAGK